MTGEHFIQNIEKYFQKGEIGLDSLEPSFLFHLVYEIYIAKDSKEMLQNSKNNFTEYTVAGIYSYSANYRIKVDEKS